MYLEGPPNIDFCANEKFETARHINKKYEQKPSKHSLAMKFRVSYHFCLKLLRKLIQFSYLIFLFSLMLNVGARFKVSRFYRGSSLRILGSVILNNFKQTKDRQVYPTVKNMQNTQLSKGELKFLTPRCRTLKVPKVGAFS